MKRTVVEIISYLVDSLQEGDLITHKGRKKGEKTLTQFYKAEVGGTE